MSERELALRAAIVAVRKAMITIVNNAATTGFSEAVAFVELGRTLADLRQQLTVVQAVTRYRAAA